MKVVCFWKVSDTVIDVNQPSRIYEVIAVEKRKHGVWIKLKILIDQTVYSAYENTLLNQNLIGYRKCNEVEIYQ